MVVGVSQIQERLHLYTGSIVTLEVDAIVNAANNSLLGGGGVDGVIHRAAGPALLDACRALGGCETGDVKATPAFNLPARYVLHAVGPKWKSGGADEQALLARSYRRALRVARDLSCRSVAFPALSTGAYGFPLPIAAEIAVQTVIEGLRDDPGMSVTLVSLPARNQRHLERAAAKLGVPCSLKS